MSLRSKLREDCAQRADELVDRAAGAVSKVCDRDEDVTQAVLKILGTTHNKVARTKLVTLLADQVEEYLYEKYNDQLDLCDETTKS